MSSKLFCTSQPPKTRATRNLRTDLSCEYTIRRQPADNGSSLDVLRCVGIDQRGKPRDESVTNSMMFKRSGRVKETPEPPKSGRQEKVVRILVAYLPEMKTDVSYDVTSGETP